MRAGLFHILLCLLTAGLCGCGGPAKIRALRPDSVIVAFGDSITAGEGASAEDNYPSVLATMTGCKVVNAGVSGETSAEGLRRLPSVLQAHKPDLVILCLGGNDMLAKLDEGSLRRNLEAMTEAIRANGSDVILLGVPKPGLILRSPGLYRAVARKYRLLYDVEILSEILSSPSLKNDYVHPNAAGYRKLAEAVTRLIRDNGGGEGPSP